MPQIQKKGNKDKQQRSPQGAAKRTGRAITSKEGMATKPRSLKRTSPTAEEEGERINTAGVKKPRVAIAVTSKERRVSKKPTRPTSAGRGQKKPSGKWHAVPPPALTPDEPKKAAHRMGPKTVGSAEATAKRAKRRDPLQHPRKKKAERKAA
jgi:hypothetical protein